MTTASACKNHRNEVKLSDSKTFSIAEIILWSLFILIGLNLLAALPVILLQLPEIMETAPATETNDLLANFDINLMLSANIAWQLLLILTVVLLLRAKKVDGKNYLRLNVPIERRGLFITALAFAFFLFIVSPAAEAFDVPPNPIMEYLFATGNIYLLALTAVILAPLAEELFFRGWLYRAIEENYGSLATIHISSFLFMIIHIQYGLPELLIVWIIAYTLALLRHFTQNLIYPILLHFLNNVAAMLQFLLLSENGGW
jgi:membrane protease YdiL (CAAX protease family)